MLFLAPFNLLVRFADGSLDGEQLGSNLLAPQRRGECIFKRENIKVCKNMNVQTEMM